MSHRIQKANQRTSGLSSTVKCLFCSRRLSSARSLQFHRIAKHSSEFYQCHKCDKKFFNKASLSKHFDQVHEEATDCKECDVTFRESSSLTKHNQRFHGEFLCTHSNCKHKLHTLEHLRRHITQYHDTEFRNESTCKTCGRCFKGGKKALASHMNSVHWLENFKENFGKTENNGDNESHLESLIPLGKLSITGQKSGSGVFVRARHEPVAPSIKC